MARFFKHRSRRSQIAEMQHARQEGRQPVCIHCGRPLNKLLFVHSITKEWVWEEETHRYLPEPLWEGEGEIYCARCKTGGEVMYEPDISYL